MSESHCKPDTQQTPVDWNNVTYRVVWQLHELRDELLLLRLVRLRGDHVADSLVEGVNLLWRQVDSNAVQHPQDLVHKRLSLPCLLHDEVATALLGDLDERVARHVLDTCYGISPR